MPTRSATLCFVLVATLLLGVLGPAGHALAAPPREVVKAPEGTIQSGTPRAVAMDGAGRTFVVVTSYTGASDTTTRDIYVYRMDGTVISGTTLSAPSSATSGSLDHGLTLVAMASGDGAAPGFATAGFDKRLYFFNSHPSRIDRPEWSMPLTYTPTALAVDPAGTYVVVGETSEPAPITGAVTSYVTVFANPALSEGKRLQLSEPIVGITYVKGTSDTLLVTTTKSVVLVKISGTGAPVKASKDFTPLSGTAVKSALSDDGTYGVVATKNRNYLYFFNFSGATTTTLRSPTAAELPSEPTSLALDAAGQRGVAGLKNGQVAYFERNTDDTITVRALFNAAARVITGVSLAKDGNVLLVASNDAGGSGITTTSNGNVAAYATPIVGNTPAPLWKASTGAYAPTYLAAARDGKTFGVAGTSNDGSRTALVLKQFGSVTLAPATGETTQKALPSLGAGVSFDVVVKNTGSLIGNYTFTGRLTDVLSGAAQWTTEMNRTHCRLLPDEACALKVTFRPPQGVDPGQYNLELNASSADGGKGSLFFRVSVDNIRSIVLKAKDNVVLKNFQRSSSAFSILVENHGNRGDNVTLNVQQTLSDFGASWTVTTPTVFVPKSSSREVQLQLTPHRDAPSGQINTLRVTARIGTEPLTTNTLELTATVEALPKVELKAVKAEIERTNTSLKIPTEESQIVRLRLTNTGNVDDSYRIWANITPSTRASQWESRVDITTVTLKKGESREITLYLAPLKKTSGPANVLLEVKSTLGASATRTFQLERIPSVTTESTDTPWYTVPGLETVLVTLALLGTALVAARRRSV